MPLGSGQERGAKVNFRNKRFDKFSDEIGRFERVKITINALFFAEGDVEV